MVLPVSNSCNTRVHSGSSHTELGDYPWKEKVHETYIHHNIFYWYGLLLLALYFAYHFVHSIFV